MSSYYLGGGLFVLALWACWRVRESRVWILGGALLLSLIMALGDNAFIFVWFRKVFPFASIARYAIKFVVLAGFVVPLLAAFAFAHLLKRPPPKWTRARSLIGIATVCLILICVILWIARQHPFPYDQWPVTLASGVTRGL